MTSNPARVLLRVGVTKQKMISEKLCLTQDCLVSHQQLVCCQSFCAVLNGKKILVYCLPPLQLTGHHSDISVMTVGRDTKPVLCSASADYIIIWDIESCQQRAREGKIAVGTIIGTLLGEVIHLSFSVSNDRVAVCTDDTVYILNSKVRLEETISSLTGHLGSLTSAEFCSWNSNILITTSEDRTFKVWDLQTESVYYQSYVLSGSPLISVLFLSQTQLFVVGSLDGQIWCFSLTDEKSCRLVTKTDLQKTEKRHRILSYITPSQQAFSIVNCVLGVKFCLIFDCLCYPCRNSCWLCIGSTDGLYMLDLASAELISVLYFKGVCGYIRAGTIHFCHDPIHIMILMIRIVIQKVIMISNMFMLKCVKS
uniref:WD repeat domain 27 n=1 Tax=Neogobius melanostomus TaxID=47308 RepID=A0A8C6USL2_9GOBI